MKKLFILFAVCFGMFVFCGCGHNAIQFSKGIGFDAGFDPEHMSARVNLRYGEILSVAARDNIEVELATGVEGGQESAQAKTVTDSALKIKIGQQVNGYFVEAIEAGADAKDLIQMNGNYPPADTKTEPEQEEVKAAEQPTEQAEASIS